MSEQAGYSGTPLARKLGVKDASTLLLLDAPPGWSVPDVPPSVQVLRSVSLGKADVVVAFCRSGADVGALVAGVDCIPARGALWVAWPRKAAGHLSDVSDHLLRELLLPTGLVDVKVAALDHDWSGLKFLWRKENRDARGSG
jgi:hypothetical protein